MRSRGISGAATAVVVVILALAVVTVVYVDSGQGNSDQISSLQSAIQSLTKSSSTVGNNGLPVMNQPPTIRNIRETWYLSTSAHQDRFDPSFIIVNQGDTVHLTLIDNDTVAHDFVVGPPYNIIVNATVPGLVNDLTGQTFTTPSRNNAPGCCGLGQPTVTGVKGSVTAMFSFVAKYSGIYEFVCTYHAQVGMIGYLVVLPNAGYTAASSTSTTSTSTTSTSNGASVAVSIVTSAVSPANRWFSPDNITVVLGVNSTVTWTNNDSNLHTITSTSVPSGAASFDSGTINSGQTFTYTFTVPGVYVYHCLIHPWMTGKVIVKS